MRGKNDNKEWDLSKNFHSLARVSKYKRGDIKEVDIMELRGITTSNHPISVDYHLKLHIAITC